MVVKVEVRGYSPMPCQSMALPWQAAQPDVTLAWISAFAGGGDMNSVAPIALMALPGTKPDGALLWQDSHAAVVGICAGEPAHGIWMMLLMPKPTTAFAAWHEAQPPVMPAWLKAEPLNLAPSTTGNCRLPIAPTWQVSQAWLFMATWPVGGAIKGGTILAVANLAAFEALWQSAQLVFDDGALA